MAEQCLSYAADQAEQLVLYVILGNNLSSHLYVCMYFDSRLLSVIFIRPAPKIRSYSAWLTYDFKFERILSKLWTTYKNLLATVI